MAIPLAAMYLLDSDPQAVMQPNMSPFLFEKLAIPIGIIIISVGALFLTCLIGFSLMEAMVLNQSLAMIQIKPSYARPDVKVEIKGETLSCTATTHTLPFYDPDKKKRKDS